MRRLKTEKWKVPFRSFSSVISVLLLTALAGYAQAPQRIVSLAPPLTKMLYLLGEENNLVGCTSYCEDAIKDHKNVVASAMEVNIEKVFLAKPDLVMATSVTKPSTVEALRKLGLKVSIFAMPKSFEQICTQFKEVGQSVGKQVVAQNIVSRQNERLASLQKAIPKDKHPTMFFEIGAKPLYTVVPNTFMNDYIKYTGGVNVAADLKSGTITRESVLMRNPEVIVVVTMGIVGDEEKAMWKSFTNLHAAKNGKIFIIDSYKACSPSPVGFVDIAEQIIKMVYQ
jgi:ABC-type Fe3+-hydroxamate transport system substrate-binding protein